MTDKELDRLELLLQDEIDRPENKTCSFGRTRVDYMADDCLRAIRGLRTEQKHHTSTSNEKLLAWMDEHWYSDRDGNPCTNNQDLRYAINHGEFE